MLGEFGNNGLDFFQHANAGRVSQRNNGARLCDER
jgi:hypothetical protein